MAWVEKDHNDRVISTPCYVQGRQPADQAAQSHIQPGLECLHGWGIHNLPGQPVPVPHHLCVKNFLLISNLNLPCLSTEHRCLSPGLSIVPKGRQWLIRDEKQKVSLINLMSTLYHAFDKNRIVKANKAASK